MRIISKYSHWTYAIFFLFCLNSRVLSNPISSELEYPEVGKPMPGDFVLRNIVGFKKSEARLSDFRGKWLVLDFWTLHCGSCIAAMPRINTEAFQFKEEIQFMLVGAPLSYDPKGSIEKTYDAIRKRIKLQIPCAFDSILFKRYDLFNVPYIIVVDPNGIVKGITAYIDSSLLTDFINGKTPKLRKAFRANENKGFIEFDNRKLLSVDGNGGDESGFLYRSFIKKCGVELKKDYLERVEEGTDMFQAVRIGVEDLFKFAYIGQVRWSMNTANDSVLCSEFWPHPRLEVKDSSVFKSDAELGINTFCYSLKVPKAMASRKSLMKIIQNDLEHCFGFKGKIVEMEMPCLNLVVKDTERIRLGKPGGKLALHSIDYPLKYYWENCPIQVLMGRLVAVSHLEDLPVIDQTGLNLPLNLLIDCYWQDTADVRRSLNLNGLDLIKGTKKMKVLVIKDSE